jgi:hypothetical protein
VQQQRLPKRSKRQRHRGGSTSFGVCHALGDSPIYDQLLTGDEARFGYISKEGNSLSNICRTENVNSQTQYYCCCTLIGGVGHWTRQPGT